MLKYRTLEETLKSSNIMTNPLNREDPGQEPIYVRADLRDVVFPLGAQRELNAKHAQEIADNFQWDKAKTPTAYRRGKKGPLWVTDAQHTITAAKAFGINEMTIQVFEVDEDLSDADFEFLLADQFAYINGKNRKMDKFTTHKVDLIRKHVNALKVQAVCDKHGVKLIPTSQRRKAIPGALSHVESAYKMVMNIGAAATHSAFAFHRTYWPHDQIESNIAWGLARFFKEFDPSKEDGDPGAQYDELVLYKALTNGGKRDLTEIMVFLRQVYPNLGLPMDTKGDVWIAKTMRYVYNVYVTKQSLSAPHLDTFIY